MTMGSPRAVHPLWFPATYLLHATEEYCCGETFPAWISRLAGVHFTAEGFLWLNGIAMVAMLIAARLAALPRTRWLLAALATVVVINAMAHLVGSLATWSYSPGVVTGTLLWLPLGATTLHRARTELSRRGLFGGVAAGILAHAAVSGVVLAS